MRKERYRPSIEAWISAIMSFMAIRNASAEATAAISPWGRSEFSVVQEMYEEIVRGRRLVPCLMQISLHSFSCMVVDSFSLLFLFFFL